jgi:hypothetical protein
MRCKTSSRFDVGKELYLRYQYFAPLVLCNGLFRLTNYLAKVAKEIS